jgi:hypothetical protein
MSLGACPRTGILSKIEAFLKNKHSHIADITSIVFLEITKSLDKRAFSDSLLGSRQFIINMTLEIHSRVASHDLQE